MAAIRQAMRRFMPATWGKSVVPARASEQKVVLGDYYAALAATGLYSSYRARPWPVERAVAEAYERVVWIYKAVEAVSSASSQLSFELRRGEEALDDHPMYRVLNKRANPLETGRQFRKRLSAQILLSKRGAFVEVTKSRGGDVIRMDLLPPGRTTPVPGKGEELLSHYEVLRVDGSRYEIPPERVRWFREPHPLDPYCGVTPLEAAGMSIELDFFTRLYNVAFLKNDARPGGVLAVNGDMGPNEMNRLESRFAKGAPNAGNLSVINGEVSYIDLAAQPRDMQYETTSSIAKKEILSAFGVPESVIGDASGRTFDNAEQEFYNFWTVTMPAHLNLLVTGFDEDSEDDLEGAFDLSGVEVLQRAAIARRAEAREEFDKGLIRIDEYRELAGYEPVGNEHTRSLYLPAGRTALPTSDADAKKFEQEAAAKFERQQQAAIANIEAPQKDEEGRAAPKAPRAIEAATGGDGRSSQREEVFVAKAHPVTPPGGARPALASFPTIRLTPSAPLPLPQAKAAPEALESMSDLQAHDRLEAALEAALAALMVRLTARAAIRLSSPKARKNTRHWTAEHPDDTRIGVKAVNVEQAVDPSRWESEAEQAAQPLIDAAAGVAAAALLSDLDAEESQQSDATALVGATVAGIVALLGASAARQADRLVQLLAQADQAGQSMAEMTLTVRSYAQKMTSWAKAVAAQAATATINGAREAAARALADREPDRSITRQWRHRGDAKVRASHRAAGGQQQALGTPFLVGEELLRYPGDESGPPHETHYCRCWLLYRSTTSGRFVPVPAGEVVRNPYRKQSTTPTFSSGSRSALVVLEAAQKETFPDMKISVKRRAFDESRVRRDDDGQFADVPGVGNDAPAASGGNSRFATRADDARRSQGQTRSNFVHPVTGATMGKAMDIRTPILTAKGWTVLGEIWPGDEVHTPDGELARVTFVSKTHQRPCYRMTFQDGEELIAADDHRWAVRYKPERTNGALRIVTTEWIASLSRCNGVSIPLTRPLQRPDLELPVDPYVLGAWLGDGSSYKAEMTEGSDPEICQEIEKHFTASYVAVKNGVTQRGYLGLWRKLKDLGLIGKGAKRVPEDYLLASERQRLSLLRGLMDTDGGVTIPASDRQVSVVEFSSTTKALAEGVQHLARSLGWRAAMREGRSQFNGRDCGPRWRVTWQATQGYSPFSLERKTARLTQREDWSGRFATGRTIRSIEPVGVRDVVCIEVDHPSHLFLAGRSLIPTHNTETGDTYEALFEAKGAALLEARYGGSYEAVATTGGWLSRNTPLDFKVGDRGGELKSLSSLSTNQKTAIKKEEIERKQKAVADAGLKPLLVVQVIDQDAGTVQVYAFEEFASKAVKKMEHLGEYAYTVEDFENAQKKTGHHDKREARAAGAKDYSEPVRDDDIEDGDLVIELGSDGVPRVYTKGA